MRPPKVYSSVLNFTLKPNYNKTCVLLSHEYNLDLRFAQHSFFPLPCLSVLFFLPLCVSVRVQCVRTDVHHVQLSVHWAQQGVREPSGRTVQHTDWLSGFISDSQNYVFLSCCAYNGLHFNNHINSLLFEYEIWGGETKSSHMNELSKLWAT